MMTPLQPLHLRLSSIDTIIFQHFYSLNSNSLQRFNDIDDEKWVKNIFKSKTKDDKIPLRLCKHEH